MDDPYSENPIGLQKEIAPCPPKPCPPNTPCTPNACFCLSLRINSPLGPLENSEGEEILFIFFPCPLTLKTLGF